MRLDCVKWIENLGTILDAAQLAIVAHDRAFLTDRQFIANMLKNTYRACDT